MATLDELAIEHGTDKSTLSHGYTRWYETYFEPIRQEPITLLELGWGGHDDPTAGGQSAATWRAYFPHATIVVVDIAAKTVARPGVHFHQGSQADPAFLTDLHERYGDFDIVIDDASHLSSLTIRSWQLLYPRLAPGGIYVVEDTHMAYHDFYYGTSEANRDPDVPRSDGQPTMMQYFRRLADEVNCSGRTDWELYPPRYSLGYRLDWIHFYYNILFTRKSG